MTAQHASIAENTASGVNIGSSPVSATDHAYNDPLTYTLGGTDAGHRLAIVSTTGQLQTSADLDYETKNTVYGYSILSSTP